MQRRTFISGFGLMALTKVVAHSKTQRIFDEGIDTSAHTAVEPLEASLKDAIGARAFRLDLLPFLRVGEQTHQFCSYDRAGDNYDYEYFPLYIENSGECVIFDAFGPGCLSRMHMNIWHDAKISKDVNIRFYFDDEPRARIDMDVSTFFSETNPLGIFRPPLAYDAKTRFRMFYHPMFFRKRLKICLSSEPGGGPAIVSTPWTGRYNKVPDPKYHWYEFTYQLFTENLQGMDSWTPAAGRDAMPELLKMLEPSITGADPKPTQGNRNETIFRKIQAGQTAVLWHAPRDASAITALRIKVDPPNNPDALFDTWLRITFDRASSPQIDVPVGCFFGAYRTSLESSYAALPLGYSNGEGYCYFPMPFWRSAVLEIDNRGQNAVTVTTTLSHTTARTPAYPQQNCGYLNAYYTRQDPRTDGRDYTYLETTGRGQVVGHVVMRWDTSEEEDERTYFDGSRTPWIIGDGYEDDHDMGWGLQNITQPLFGAISAKSGSGGIYRFLLPDMYCFSDAIKYGHQTYGPHSPLGHEGKYQVGTEESVTFWYGTPHARLIMTDELDIGNAASEAFHDYRAGGAVERMRGAYWYDGEFNNVLFSTPATVDTGISFTGECTFTVSVSPNNQGVRLRRRCDKENNRQRALVYVDGQMVTERPWYSVDYEKTYRDIRWFDSDFEIPARYTKGKSEIAVRVEFVSSKTGRWDEYHYWVYSYLAV